MLSYAHYSEFSGPSYDPHLVDQVSRPEPP